MPASLTARVNADREGGDGKDYGLACPEHPTAERTGLTERHAHNAVAKHNRDHHAEPSLALWALADVVLQAQEDWKDAQRDHDDPRAWAAEGQRAETLRAAWCVLTGMSGNKAMDYAHMVKRARTTAHITPF